MPMRPWSAAPAGDGHDECRGRPQHGYFHDRHSVRSHAPDDHAKQRPASAAASRLRGAASLETSEGGGSGDWRAQSEAAQRSPLYAGGRMPRHRTQQTLERSASSRMSSSASSTSSRASSYATSDSHSIDIPDLSSLNIRPAERGQGLVQCDLERSQGFFKGGGLTGGDGMSFRLYVAGTDELILSAKKKGNEFLISSYPSNQHCMNHCAILSWNNWRTEFFLHSRWCELCEPEATPFTCATAPENREMLAAIMYEKNYKGDCPRKFTVVVPAINRRGHREVFCPLRRKKDLVECYDSGDWSNISPFTTKPPKWSETNQRYEGGFTGRVKIASVRNFILQKPGKTDSWLQFGKYAKHRYALDFQYPLSPIQAFAAAISSFEASMMYT